MLHKLGKKNMWKPAFALRKIRIINVGVVDDIEIDFQSKGLTCLYAGNGAGKTTILECISLLGHLPCFSILDKNYGIKESLIEKWTEYSAQKTKYDHNKFKFSDVFNSSIDSWIEEIKPKPQSNYGIICFDVSDFLGENPGSGTCSHRFCILVHDDLLKGELQPRLTSFLSRGEFDEGQIVTENEESKIAEYDDRRLSQNGLIIYKDSDQIGQSLEKFIMKVALGRNFFISDQDSKYDHIDFKDKILNEHNDITPRFISYINTDLNDFGRGNDLRESPKDLDRDFGEEMFSRIRVSISKSGSLSVFDKLKESCEIIIGHGKAEYISDLSIPPCFDLEIVSIKDNKVNIFINRRDGTLSSPISFLSAGENEIFFVMMMVLTFTNNDRKNRSIIVLDEPDLHISVTARPRFFGEIISSCNENAQVIASSHSPLFYETVRQTFIKGADSCLVLSRKMIDYPNKMEKQCPQTRLIVSNDEFYLRSMRGVFVDRSFFGRFIRAAGNIITLERMKIKDALNLSDWSAVSGMIAAIFGLITFIYFAIGKVVNDTLQSAENREIFSIFLRGYDEKEYHDFSNEPFFISLSGVLGYILTVYFFKKRRQKIRRDAIESFREFKS